ncbi:MAG: hypothetical protein ACLRFE_01255 [Clostridia bacterium]
MDKINASKFINVLLSKYKAKEIDRKKFALLLTGQESDSNLSNSELMENCIDDEIKNIKYFLINDTEVLNKNCKCLPSSFGNIEQHMPYTTYPYILVALGISQDNSLIEDYYIMSSFEHNIFEEMRNL